MKTCFSVKCLIAGFVLMFALVGTVFAAPLRDADIKNFISSLKEIQTLEEEYDDLDQYYEDEAFDSGKSAEMPDNIMSDSIARLKGHEIYGRMQGIARSHGFRNVEQWAKVGDRVLRAFFTITFEEEDRDIKAEMERSLREIDENPYMTDEQKQEIKQMMQNTMASVEYMTGAPAEDVRAVRPHMDALRQVMEYDDYDDDDDYDY